MERPWLTLDLLSKPPEAIRRIDIVHRIRRSMSSLGQVVRHSRLELGAVRRVLLAALPVDAVSRFRGRVLSLGRIRWRPRVRLGLVRKALETARSLAVDIWAQRHVFLHVRVRHLRLAAIVMLVTATAIALFRYTAELDVAVRHWVPSAPPSGEAPPLVGPPIVASTEPAPPVRDTRADRPAKTSASNSAQREQPLQKDKNGGAKQTPASGAAPLPQALPSGPRVASAAPRNDMASETVSASAPPSSADMRPSLDVVGRLRVNSRREAERDLAALVARVGGTTVSRRRGDKITVMEAVVPNPSYDKFAEGLRRIGSWQIEAGRSRLPDPVRMTVRLTE